MGLSFKRISISSSISVPNCMLLPQNPQLFHHSAGLEVYQVSQKIARLVGCGMKSTLAIFKLEISIYQSNANLDMKILVGKITHR